MKTFHYELVKDPTYFCDNRVEAHSDHHYYCLLYTSPSPRDA